MTNIERRKWDWRNVRDFDWLSTLKEELSEFQGGEQMRKYRSNLGLG